MKYFRLRFNILFENGSNGGCIYDLQNHKMIYVPADNAELIEKAENNELVDESNEFIMELISKGYGDLYENKVYIEKSRFGAPKEYSDVVVPRVSLNTLYIQVTNECDNNCVFCNQSNDINTKTHCKKWNNKIVKIDPYNWSKIFSSVRKLGCRKVVFIGGNPFLEFESIREKVILADAVGITNFEIVTPLSVLTGLQLDFIQKYNITINIQIVGRYENVEYLNDSEQIIFNNILKLIERKINVSASVLVTKYNENYVSDIILYLKTLGINRIKEDLLYDCNDTYHYSTKYKDKQFDRQFVAVTRENISYLSQHNSCLYGKAYINLSGNVTPCPMMNDYICGNILESDIKSILESKTYQNIIYLTKEKLRKCSGCAFKLNCIECRALERSATKEIDGIKYCNVSDKEEIVDE